MIYLALQIFSFLFLVSVAIALWPLVLLALALCIPVVIYTTGGWPALIAFSIIGYVLVISNERQEKEKEAKTLDDKDYPFYLD